MAPNFKKQVPCQKNNLKNSHFYIKITDQGRPQVLGEWGGGQEFFFLRFGNLHVAKPCALLGGFGGMCPRIFFKNGAIWCVLVYIWIRFLTLKNFKSTIFYIIFFFKLPFFT